MLERVSRETMASGTSDRVTAGRIRWREQDPRAPPSPAGEYMPVPGSQPSFTEKPMIMQEPDPERRAC